MKVEWQEVWVGWNQLKLWLCKGARLKTKLALKFKSEWFWSLGNVRPALAAHSWPAVRKVFGPRLGGQMLAKKGTYDATWLGTQKHDSPECVATGSGSYYHSPCSCRTCLINLQRFNEIPLVFSKAASFLRSPTSIGRMILASLQPP